MTIASGSGARSAWACRLATAAWLRACWGMHTLNDLYDVLFNSRDWLFVATTTSVPVAHP